MLGTSNCSRIFVEVCSVLTRSCSVILSSNWSKVYWIICHREREEQSTEFVQSFKEPACVPQNPSSNIGPPNAFNTLLMMIPLEDKHKVDENKVKGCQSTVWLVADYKNGRVHYRAESDAVIVKGLISMLIRVLSGQTPDDIVNARLDFIRDIGMMSHLAQTRSNGLLSMVKQMKNYALAYKLKAANS